MNKLFPLMMVGIDVAAGEVPRQSMNLCQECWKEWTTDYESMIED